MICKKCNKTVEDNITKCPFCGNFLHEEEDKIEKGAKILAGIEAGMIGSALFTNVHAEENDNNQQTVNTEDANILNNQINPVDNNQANNNTYNDSLDISTNNTSKTNNDSLEINNGVLAGGISSDNKTSATTSNNDTTEVNDDLEFAEINDNNQNNDLQDNIVTPDLEELSDYELNQLLIKSKRQKNERIKNRIIKELKFRPESKPGTKSNLIEKVRKREFKKIKGVVKND